MDSLTQLREEEQQSLEQVRTEMDDLMVALDIGRDEVAKVENDIEARQEQLARLETQLSEWRDELSTLDERLHVENPASGDVPDLTGEQQNQQENADADSGEEGEDAQADETSQQSSN